MRTTIRESNRLRLMAIALAGLGACGGKTVSLGTTGLMSISLSELAGSVPACSAGAAHRNACCFAGADGNAECGIYPSSPFHSCDPDWTTYPVPGTCCDLADPTQCGAPPASPPSPPAPCVYACPPGYTAQGPLTLSSGACCVTGSQTSMCFGWGTNGGAGMNDAGDPSTLCTVPCPSGWQQVGPLCFNGSESFSQATGPGPVGSISTGGSAPGTAGASTGSASTGSASTGSASTGWAAGGTTVPLPPNTATTGIAGACDMEGGPSDGHSYSLSCSNATQICTCTKDATTTTIAGVIVCSTTGNSALVDMWLQGCGFPP